MTFPDSRRDLLGVAVAVAVLVTLLVAKCGGEAPVGPAVPVPAFVEREPAPDPDSAVAHVLAGHPDSAVTDPVLLRIARSVRAASEWYGMDPLRIARVIWVESRADSSALGPPIRVSIDDKIVRTRAVGLGQTVPEIWMGVFPECGADLATVRTQVCYTVLVWRWYQDMFPGDQVAAALGYNGCRGGPCERYADDVLVPLFW